MSQSLWYFVKAVLETNWGDRVMIGMPEGVIADLSLKKDDFYGCVEKILLGHLGGTVA